MCGFKSHSACFFLNQCFIKACRPVHPFHVVRPTNIAWNNISEVTLPNLAKLPNLRSLDVHYTAIHIPFRNEDPIGFPALKTLDTSYNEGVDYAARTQFQYMPTLTTITVDPDARWTRALLRHIPIHTVRADNPIMRRRANKRSTLRNRYY